MESKMARRVFTASGLRRELDGDFGDQRERAFGAYEKTREIVAGARRLARCRCERFRPSGRTSSSAVT